MGGPSELSGEGGPDGPPAHLGAPSATRTQPSWGALRHLLALLFAAGGLLSIGLIMPRSPAGEGTYHATAIRLWDGARGDALPLPPGFDPAVAAAMEAALVNRSAQVQAHKAAADRGRPGRGGGEERASGGEGDDDASGGGEGEDKDEGDSEGEGEDEDEGGKGGGEGSGAQVDGGAGDDGGSGGAPIARNSPPPPAAAASDAPPSASVTPDPKRNRHVPALLRRSALLIVAHRWNAAIEAGVRPFLLSAQQWGMAAHVLAQDLPRLDPPPPPGVVVTHATLAAVRATYPHFLHAHISNHFHTMHWWRAVGRAARVRQVWVVEPDVRAAGDLSRLWATGIDKAYLSTHPISPLASRFWDRKFTGRLRTARHKWWALRQVCRLSGPFLEYLDAQFAAGHNGQDEATLATLAMEFAGARGVGSVAYFLGPHFSFDKRASDANRADWEGALDAAAAGRRVAHGLQLFHPVKD